MGRVWSAQIYSLIRFYRSVLVLFAMAFKDLQLALMQGLRLGDWARSGLLVVFCLGGTAPAIAATSRAPLDLTAPFPADLSPVASETDPELAPLPDSERFLVPPSESVSEESEDLDLEPTEADTPAVPTEPKPTPPEDPAASPEPPGFAPDPAYTAPLPLPGPLPSSPPGLPPRQTSPDPNTPFWDSLLAPQTPQFDTYRLGPGDAIFVNVRQFPDLSFQATLDIQGNIIVPLQGVTSLNGRTLEETEALIRQIYNQYVVDPDVSLTLVAQRGVEVTILGEVVRPGFYPLGAPQISAALLSAGGTTGEADLRTIQIQRRLPDGQLLERTVDLFSPLKEGRELPDVALQDGDVIVVERLDPGALDEYDRALVSRSTLAQPVITVRFLNYGSGSLGGATSGSLTALDLPNGSRFADALVRANLNPDTSNLGEVALIRFDEEAGRALTTTVDGNDAFRGDPSANPPLRDNDVIIVNRTVLAKITYALNTFTQPFRDVLGFLLFFDQLADSADSLFGP
jgi:polysaccharide export outer membrane protein